MKIFNLKSFLSFFAVIAVLAVTFTACNKEIADNTDQLISPIQAKSVQQGQVSLLIPEHIAENAEKIPEFVNALSEEELNLRLESYKIFSFLKATNNLEKLYQDNPNFDILTKEDFQKYAPQAFAKHGDDFSAIAPPSIEPVEPDVIPTPDECLIINMSCSGNTMVTTTRCCSILGNCSYFTVYDYNHPDCVVSPCSGVLCAPNEYCVGGICYINPDDPCNGVLCGLNQYCKNGQCHDYIFTPKCFPPCNIGEQCVNNNCI